MSGKRLVQGLVVPFCRLTVVNSFSVELPVAVDGERAKQAQLWLVMVLIIYIIRPFRTHPTQPAAEIVCIRPHTNDPTLTMEET